MEYQNILNQIKMKTQHDDFSLYLDDIIDKMIQNNSLSQSSDCIYGFYISSEDRASISVNKLGNLEFLCEQTTDDYCIVSKQIELANLEHNIFSLQYYRQVFDFKHCKRYSIFETMIFNEDCKLVHVRYEVNGESTTIATKDLESYSSFFQQEKFRVEGKKI